MTGRMGSLHATEATDRRGNGLRSGTYLVSAGVLFAVGGVLFLVTQVGRFDWQSVRSISEHWTSSPAIPVTWAILNGTAAVASGIAARGAIGLSAYVRRGREPWLSGLTAVAIAGYAIVGVTNVVDWYSIGRMARAFPGLDAEGQAAMERAGPAILDPTLAWRCLTLGPWMGLVSAVAWRRGLLRPLAAPLGIVAGTAAVVFALASARWPMSTLVLAIVAVVVHPLWLIAAGLALRTHHGLVGSGRPENRHELQGDPS